MKQTVAMILALFVIAGCGRKIDLASELHSLVEIEREFAKTSIEKGHRLAFLDYFAEDAVLFRPYPVSARAYLLEQPADESRLTWEPIHADISRSGDMGYTTGPWEYRAHPEDTLVFHGHYISVWKKQLDGSWKVVIDVGTSNPPPNAAPPPLKIPPAGAKAAAGRPNETDRETELAALLNRDRSFAVMARDKGAHEAFYSFANDDIRTYRRGSYPFIGRKSLAQALAGMAGTLSWNPSGGDVSRAGDLGYTYGTALLAGDSTASGGVEHLTYVRIWRKQEGGIWTVAVDVMNPAPPPEPAPIPAKATPTQAEPAPHPAESASPPPETKN